MIAIEEYQVRTLLSSLPLPPIRVLRIKLPLPPPRLKLTHVIDIPHHPTHRMSQYQHIPLSTLLFTLSIPPTAIYNTVIPSHLRSIALQHIPKAYKAHVPAEKTQNRAPGEGRDLEDPWNLGTGVGLSSL